MNQELENQAWDGLFELAEKYIGATSPNPCVGAAALSKDGRILSVQAHQKAGTAHAEAAVIADLRRKNLLSEAHTLLVSLEPCNHQGRTSPCADAIIRAHHENSAFQKLIFICRDPNPKVPGHGEARLRDAGIETHCLEEEAPLSAHVTRGKALIRTFAHWSQTGRPWITLKTAKNLSDSMIPPVGSKTFTSESSLRLAHELRKRSDAILTGSGTIFADHPLFTVRHIGDHPGKKRWLVIMDRRARLASPEGQNYIKQAEDRGFRVITETNLEKTADFLGSHGCLEILVEAGPTLSSAFIESGLWDEQIIITVQLAPLADRIEVLRQKR